MKFLCTLAVATFLLFGSAKSSGNVFGSVKSSGSAFCPDPKPPVTAQRAIERMPTPEQADRIHECQKEALNDQATPNVELPANWSLVPAGGRSILANTGSGFAAPCSITRGQATRALLVLDGHNAKRPVYKSKKLRKDKGADTNEFIRTLKLHNLAASIVRRHFA